MADNMNVLILPSEDGQDYIHAILYPQDWACTKADRLAIEAFTAAQISNLDEWSWNDFEPELTKRGFVIPCWHNGPTWDRCRLLQAGGVNHESLG